MENYFAEKSQQYLKTLYKALFVAAYYGLLRAGEVTEGPHVILANNVHIGTNKDKILFILKSSKTHTKANKPQLIKFSREAGHGVANRHYPFQLLKDYISE